MSTSKFRCGGWNQPSRLSLGIAAVTTFGYVVEVAGPPLVGSVAETINLWTALLLMVAVSIVIAAAALCIRASDDLVESYENI